MKFKICLAIILTALFFSVAFTSRALSVPVRWSRLENEDLQLASDVAASAPCITVIWQAPAAPGDTYLAYFPYEDPEMSNLVYLLPGRRYYVYCNPRLANARQVEP